MTKIPIPIKVNISDCLMILECSNSQSFERFPAVPCVSNYRTLTVVELHYQCSMQLLRSLSAPLFSPMQIVGFPMRRLICYNFSHVFERIYR